jgi:hypothetical protein
MTASEGPTLNNFGAMPSSDQTGFAVAMGVLQEQGRSSAESLMRVEKGQVEGFRKIDETFQGMKTTQGEHSVMLGELKTRVDAHDKVFAERQPVKVSWTAVGGFIFGIIGAAALVWSLLPKV